ncbi:hypothetical protein SAMN05428985_1151, partial [Nocardioides sp. YR527]
SRTEKDLLTSWAEGGQVNPVTGEKAPPRGRGKFLFKVGKKAGVPFKLDLLDVETGVHDTNRAWADQIEAMQRAGDDVDDDLDSAAY